MKKIDDPVKDALDKGALRVANDTKYGLSAGLFSNDITKALYPAEGLGAGTVHVNSGSIDADAVFLSGAAIPAAGVERAGAIPLKP